jgi:hypothetical protein
MPFDDGFQNGRIGKLQQDVNGLADEGVEDFRRLMEKIEVERQRNDRQSARIKALTALCEKLVDLLTASGAVPATEIALALAELRNVSPKAK